MLQKKLTFGEKQIIKAYSMLAFGHVDMRTCEHAHMWRCRHVDMRTCGHTDMWTCRHIHMRTCGHAHMRACAHVHMSTCPHAHMSTCGHVDISTCQYADMATFGYVHMRTWRHVDMRTCRAQVDPGSAQISFFSVVAISKSTSRPSQMDAPFPGASNAPNVVPKG